MKLLSCYSTRALQFTKQQVHLYRSPARGTACRLWRRLLGSCFRILDQGYLTQNWSFYCGELLCNFIYWLKNWHLKIWYLDGVLSTIIKIVIIKIILVIDNLVFPEAVDFQGTVYKAEDVATLNWFTFWDTFSIV